MREKKKDWDHSVVSAQPPCLFLQDILFLSNITITPLWAELCRLVCFAVLHDIFIKLWAAGGAVEMFQTGSLWSFSVSERTTIRRDRGTKHFMIITQSHSPVHWGHCSSRTRSEPGLLGNGVSSDNRDVSDRIKPASVFRFTLVRRRDAELKKRRFNLSPGRRAASVWRWTWSAHHQTLLKNLQCCTQKPATEENSSLPPTGSDTYLIVSLSLPDSDLHFWTIDHGNRKKSNTKEKQVILEELVYGLNYDGPLDSAHSAVSFK